MSPATWRATRAEVAGRLREAGIASPDVEARWITETASGTGASDWFDVQLDRPTDRAAAHVEAMTARRARGEPLQYVLGSWSFRGLDLMVDPRVLIPRPETEWVVELALREAEHLGLRRATTRSTPAPWSQKQSTSPPFVGPREGERVVVDLGTGSGAIALALEAELPDATVWATDASEDALAVATANVAGTGATRVRCAHGHWFNALPDALAGTIDLVVANPPYVSDGELPELEPEVRDHEPRCALVSGPTGLEAIEELLDAAPCWLASPGVFLCEIAPHQAAAVQARARLAGFADVEVHDDLVGRPRALVARRP